MKAFSVQLYDQAVLMGVEGNTAVWSFSAEVLEDFDRPRFPDDFLAFDVEGSTGWPSGTLVWVADNTQALVAYDWLLEHGWEFRETGDTGEAEFLDLLNATANK